MDGEQKQHVDGDKCQARKGFSWDPLPDFPKTYRLRNAPQSPSSLNQPAAID